MSNNTNLTQQGANHTVPAQSQGYYRAPMQPSGNGGNNKNVLMWVIIALLVVLIAMVAIFLFTGSKSDAPAADAGAATEAAAPAKSTTIKVSDAGETAAPAAEASRPGFDGAYALSGKVGPARLNMNIRCSGGRITGSERYAKGSGSISLSGSYNSDGSFQMNEYWGGECCGSYSGRISTSASGASMSGSFVNSKGSSYSFNLSGSRN